MIELRNISKVFHDSKKRKVNALNNINLTFSNQGFYAIVGKSGSGKSTLLNILSGLMKPSEGDYYIQGMNTNAFNENDWAEIRSTTLSYVFQEHNLIDHLTVIENLSIALLDKNIETNEIESKIAQLLSTFDLTHLKYQTCKDLSGGEKQRIAIIRGLISDSRILIADEPTSALDEANTVMVYELLKEISKTRLVIVVTHDMDMTNRYSDTIIQLNYGKIVSNHTYESQSNTTLLRHSHSNPSFKNLHKLSKYFIRGHWVIHMFMILFITIGMTLLISTFTITQFNEDKFDYNIIHDKVDFNFISTSDIHFSTDESTSSFNLSNDLPELITYKTYTNMDCFHTGMIHDNLSRTRIFSTILIQALENNHIIITDYQADLLKESNAISFNHFNELVGSTIDINGIQLTIDDVIGTGYNLEEMNSTILAVRYDVLRINEFTLNQLIYVAYPKTIHQADYALEALHPYTLEKMSYGAYLGNNQLNGLDIVVDFMTFQRWLGITLESPEEASSYYDTDIVLSLLINDEVITQTYRLKGIVFTDQPTVYFSEDTFHTYFNESTDLSNFTSTQAFQLNSYESFIKVKSLLKNNSSYIFNEYSNTAYYAKSFIYSISQIFTALVVFALSMLSLFIYFFTYMYFRQNRFNYGILMSLGYERRITLVIAMIQIIKNILIAFIISTMFASVLLHIFNQGYQSDLNVDIDILQLTWTPFGFTGLFSILISLFGVLSVYHFIHKIDIIQLLK